MALGGSSYDSPISLPSLGSYSVSVELTDSSGNDVVVNVGQVGYHDILAFSSVTADGPASNELTYDDHAITASGVLTVTDPRTRQQSPVAGVPVTVYYGYGTGSPNPVVGAATTAADGPFSLPPYVATGAGYVTATYTPPATESLLYGGTGATQTAQQYFQTQADQLRIQMTSPTNVDEPVGGSATVTGTVQVLDGGVWKPAPDDRVELEDYSSSVAPVQGVTDNQGRISLNEPVPGTYTLEAESSAFYLWASAPTSVTVHIPQPTTFRSIGISENEYGEAAIQGVLQPGDGSQFLAPGSWVEAQYSSNGKSWYNVGRCSVTSNQFGCYGTYAGRPTATGGSPTRAASTGSRSPASRSTSPATTPGSPAASRAAATRSATSASTSPGRCTSTTPARGTASPGPRCACCSGPPAAAPGI